MLDNANGGRCLCSDRHAELEKVLEEIQKLDEQSYAMATTGVERINMGEDAAAVEEMANKVANSVNDKDTNSKTKARKSLDLSAWDINVNDDDTNDDIFSAAENVFGTADDISKLKGDALHTSVALMCANQIPECSANISMLKMMYTQQIRSDCGAYENSLKQQKNESAKKLQTAQTAMREAALEQYQNANKYDLGQCTTRFKQCMQTTADCGEDFSKCASVVAADNAKSGVGKKNKTKNYTIKGVASSITIAATTYDTLLAKKPMCENVTKQCVRVRDKVWDTFLREAAPEIKNAELIAESNVRTSCISNISQCFQKACKDTMDPNNPEGSYDLCLSRPDTVRSLCKVQIEPCISAEPKILDYVYARLKSMRVDACTNEVRDCLQNNDRCGKDYANCIGLDTDTIINMCPSEKLTACNVDDNGKTLSQSEVYDNIESIITGLMLNIDNSFLTQCQNALNAAMIKVCGDAENCTAFDSDDNMGADSLMSYKAQDGSFIIEGLLSFGNVKIKETNSDSQNVKFGTYELDISDYSDNMESVNTTEMSAVKQKVLSTLQSTQNKINQKIALLTSDPKVDYCVSGRKIKTRGNKEIGTDQGRFPHLIDSSILVIMNAGLDKAGDNYAKKYNEIYAKAIEEADDETKRVLCASMGTNIDDLENEYWADLFVKGAKKTKQLGMHGNGYELRMVVDGMKKDDIVKYGALGKGEWVQTDKEGNMLGTVARNAVYSPDTHTCLLTTTITMCDEMKDIITTSTSDSCGAGGLGGSCKSWVGALLPTLGGSKTTTTKSQEYKGTYCKKMAEPLVKDQEIKM